MQIDPLRAKVLAAAEARGRTMAEAIIPHLKVEIAEAHISHQKCVYSSVPLNNIPSLEFMSMVARVQQCFKAMFYTVKTECTQGRMAFVITW